MSSDSNLLKNTFSKVVNDYDYGRPTYPVELYEKICEFSGINQGADILEVGVGTGQATDRFIGKGFHLDLLEVSEEQVRFLTEKYKEHNGVMLHRGYFEEFASEKKYNLIYSATAFHWVNSEIGYPKAYEMLKPGGTMAVFWQMSSVTYHDTGIFLGLNEIKKKYLPEESLGFDEEGIQKVKEKRIKQIQSGGCFSEPQIFEYRWIDEYDSNRYATLVNTYSSTQLLEDDVREKYLQEIKNYIDAHGRKVEMPQLVYLYLVRREN